MTLKARITEDMKNAMRAKEATRLSTIRMLLAAMKQREVDERIELADADVVAIIDKMIKQRRESVVQFDAGKRPDLAAAERAEIELLQAYMPQPLSEAEIEALIERRRGGRRTGRSRGHGGDGQGDGGSPATVGRPGPTWAWFRPRSKSGSTPDPSSCPKCRVGPPSGFPADPKSSPIMYFMGPVVCVSCAMVRRG